MSRLRPVFTAALATLMLASAITFGTPVASASADSTTTLPKEPARLVPIATSGKHILVQSEYSYRLSHDQGKTWIAASFPCFETDGCSPETADSSSIGRVHNGVVIRHSASAGRLDAYSLMTNSVVGTSFAVPAQQDVWEKSGYLALMYHQVDQSYSVRSLLDGSDRQLVFPAGYQYVNLLDDGSVLIAKDSRRFRRLWPNGTSTPVYTSATGADLRVSENWASFTYGAKHKHCLVNLTTAAANCRSTGTRYEHVVSMSAAGLLTEVGGFSRFYFYPFKKGKIAPAQRVRFTIGPGGFHTQVSSEGGLMTLANTSVPNSSLLLLFATGKTRTLTPSWTHRSVLPFSAALTPSTLLGGVDTDAKQLTWTRSASSAIGAQKKLTGAAAVGASGSRWATSSQRNGQLRFYDRGRLKAKTYGASQSNDLILSGPHLLARPLCRNAPLMEDDDCSVPADLRTMSGKTIHVPAATEDIFGELMAVRTSDTTVSSRTVQISNYVHPSQPTYQVQFPDPGPGGYITQVRLWGDWLIATLTPTDSSLAHPVAINYRTQAVYTGPTAAKVVAVGDGFVVSVLPHSTNLQVWNVLTGTTTSLPASSSVVAISGARLAYFRGSKIVITTIPGVAQSAPRVLGVVKTKIAMRRWSLAIDLTKAVKAGRVEIRDNAGHVVRSIKAPASATGSLRGIVWDGRNTAGHKVRAGSYNYRLIAAAKDGSGAVRDVLGGNAAIGSITVS